MDKAAAKAGRNDPCPCGSGKKYKACCWVKDAAGSKKKITAKWINQPTKLPNLLERTFGSAVSESKEFKPVVTKGPVEKKQDKKTKE